LIRTSLTLSLLIAGLGCGSKTVDKERSQTNSKPGNEVVSSATDDPTCPAEANAPSLLPNVSQEHTRLDYWLERLAKKHKLDEALMSPAGIRNLNAAMAKPRAGYFPQRYLLEKVDPAEYAKKVSERTEWALDKLRKAEYVRADGSKLKAAQLKVLEQPVSMDSLDASLHVALGDVKIRCVPLAPSFHSKDKQRVNTRFDRNACSSAHNQEVVQVLKRWPNGMRLARTRYAFGWIAADAPLSQAIPADKQNAIVAQPRQQLIARDSVELDNGTTVKLRKGILLPVVEVKTKRRRKNTAAQVYVATKDGFVKSKPMTKSSLRPTARTLTRRAVLTEAWRYLNTAYGLGGVNNGRDCSRFLLDVFETFNVKLPRHSSWQSLAGTFSIDVKKTSEADRLLLIDSVAKKGMVLLHFPGHIMMYLGRNDAGKPMAIHAFAEYKKSCEQAPTSRPADEPHETLMKVKTVTVSDLEIGRGTSRKAFIERITRITVIGKSAGTALAGVAELRPAAPIVIPKRRCRDSTNNALWVSPERPYRDAPMRVIAGMSQDPGSARIALIDPDGVRHTPTLTKLGGPPHGLVATVANPKPGKWKAVVGDGERVLACENIYVRSRRSARKGDRSGPVWKPSRRWSASTENLFALFVERLFDYPIDKDLTWPNLHTLLRDQSRNILFNHRNTKEDAKIRMQPDCADLPVALRTYFAWKMRLPFGYHVCKRARNGRPPKCDLPGASDNLMSRLELKSYRGKKLVPRTDLQAFRLFANKVMYAVHSSSGRTRPKDEATDVYPVPLTRSALRPGTVYIDPFGHVLMIAKWIPQGKGGKYGFLVGADAQPDGTIGRRRFWRGSFLFQPETKAGGAGFKAWRPVYFKGDSHSVDVDDNGESVPVTRVGRAKMWSNKGLRYTKRFTKFSRQQYSGSKNDFYDTIESLINPRPLDPIVRQVSLVDALLESVSRRINSVNNGEAHMKKVNGRTMKLPRGARIFLSSDPGWEAFSTPSRDNRLLISIDSVLGFPDAIKRAPQRFGLSKGGQLDVVVERVRSRLKAELAKRTVTYTRSDGSEWKLTLKDIVSRQKGFEMAYNPNDCVEIRWGAPKGSKERATCRRHAPGYQRTQMGKYRHWFSTRKRPAN